MMMRTSSKIFLNGLMFIIAGVLVISIGRVWNIILGNEKYLIGGVTLVFGLIVFYIAIRERKRNN